MSSALTMFVEGIGLFGPGLASWTQALPVLRGKAAHRFAPTVLAPPARLPPAESRRAGAVVRLALRVADETVRHAEADPRTLPSVFASSGGEGATCHALCEALAGAKPVVSPIRFTNSVHNAAAGNWHIAVASRAASTSLSAYDGSFAAGLIEAATLLRANAEPLLLVAYDVPYPEPLNSFRPLLENFGAGFVLAPAATRRSIASLQIELLPAALAGETTSCGDASLDALRTGIPAAESLPLLQAIARLPAGEEAAVSIDYLPQLALRISTRRLHGPSA